MASRTIVGRWTHASALAALLTLALASSAVAAAPPSQVENPVKERDLAILRLDDSQVERLGIRAEPISAKGASPVREVGGLAMTIPGQAIQVAAPSEGIALAISGRAFPYPGTRVRRGEPLLQLLVVSQAELARAREIVDVASARKALADEAIAAGDASERALGEQAQASEALDAATRRMRALGGDRDSAQGGGLAPRAVTSPVDGVVRALSASAGQSVPAGAPLLEIARSDRMWVRVPLFAGDIDELRDGAEARVRRLGEPAATAREAARVAGPLSADATAATIDLYFELANPSGDEATELRDGERVAVTLELRSADDARAIAYSAVVYDMHGNSWVYQQLEPGAFARRRVDVAFVRDGVASVRTGLAEGAQVVVEGAAELFGAEFGVGK